MHIEKTKDMALVQKLFADIYGRSVEIDVLEWYNNGPFGANQWYVAHDPDPAALYAILPMQVFVNGEIKDFTLCNNIGVVKTYRGKGMFQTIGKYALGKDGRPSIGIPNNRGTSKGHKRIGWRCFGELELMGRDSGGDSGLLRDDPHLPTFNVVPSCSFEINRTADFFRWRYSHPGHKYFQHSDGNNNIVWQLYEDRVQIMELSDPNLVLDIGGPVDVWAFNGSEYHRSLLEAGFSSQRSWEFILYASEDFSVDVMDCKFELCDNDVY